MATFKLKLLKREMETENVMSLRFDKPSDLEFEAGQYLMWRAGGEEKPLSIASSPSEDFLLIATKVSDSAFKQALKDLDEGEEVECDGPFGGFTLREGEDRIVFVGGGIGVTPFRGMASFAVSKELRAELTFFYFNHTPKDIVFRDDFNELNESENFKMVNVITRPEESEEEWDGDTGHFNVNLLGKHVEDWSDALYYVCGPPKMVQALKKNLTGAGIREERVKIEEFAGY